jgi:hypothetical protein
MLLDMASQADLRPIESRFRYCLTPLADVAEDKGYLAKRAFTAGSSLLGVWKGYLRSCARSASRRGIERYIASRMNSGFPPMLGDLPSNDFGTVYAVRIKQYPCIIKFGFSRNLTRRLPELKSEAGGEIELIEAKDGSLFDEARQFLAFRDHHITDEWFFDPSLPIDGMPKFLLDRFSLDQWRAAADVAKGRGMGAGHNIMSVLYIGAMRGAA